MTKEELLFRLETFKGQLETFATSLSRSLKTGNVDKEELQKGISRLNRNYLPLREYISHFVSAHHFTAGLHGHALSEARLNTIASCITDVSIACTRIARMNDKQFTSFMKGIEYSIRRKQDEAKEQKKASDNGKKEADHLEVIQSQIQTEIIRPISEELTRRKRLGLPLILFAIGFGLFGVIFSIYFAMLQVDTFNSVREDIVKGNQQNTRIIGEIMTAIKDQAKRMNSIEQTSKRNDERIGDMVTSLTDLKENLEAIGGSELSGSIFVPLKLGKISALLEIDPSLKKGLIRARDHRTGEEVIKGLDPATTNLIIWELNELKYGIE